MTAEIVNVDGERIFRQDWLKEPVYKYQLWSPLGAHIEALACIKQGLLVTEDVFEASEADFGAPYNTFFQLIKDWNGLHQDKRGETKRQGDYYIVLTESITGYFSSDVRVNVFLSALNPDGNSAIDAKKEMLRVAVAVRLNQPDPGFQGA